MVFSSVLFIFRFLPVALLLYYLAPAKYKNLVLFVVSLIFYSWGEVRYFPIMILSTVIDFTAGQGIKRAGLNVSKRKMFLLLSIIANMGILLFFKYTDFFIGNFNTWFSLQIPLLNLTLPLGVSFYTFQTMSYSIDVYRGDVKAEENIIDFGAYVTMFPQLIAGPIVRYSDVSARLKVLKGRVSMERIEKGITIFVYGLAKKVLIANNVGALWTEISAVGFGNISTPLAWLSILAFGLQIYFDFSGYSLMAIGLGHMLGFDFPSNFNYPYISRSITEFWRRWHMTLGTWFREYVYIPLGGNRKGLTRQIFNIFIVWFLTGFWHGADWNFALWGLYYFALLTIEKLWLLKPLEKSKVFSHFYAMIAVLIGWVLFAVTDLGAMGLFFNKLFIPQSGISALYYLRNYGVSIALGVLLSTTLPEYINNTLFKNKLVRTAAIAILFLICVAYLVDSTYNPFLYFRF